MKDSSSSGPKYLWVVFIAIMGIGVVGAEEAPRLTNESSVDSHTLSMEREEELWLQTKQFVDKLRYPDYHTFSERRRWLKLLKDKNQTEQKIMERMFGELRRPQIPGEPSIDRYAGIEEVIVIGDMFDGVTLDPKDFSLQDIREMRGIRAFTNMMYRDGQYNESYPALLQLAKRGFKDAQSRLAYILFNGTEDVPKSNLRALGWLGVAAHGRTEPGFRVLFNKYMRQVPDDVRQIVDEVIDKYRNTYSHEDHVSCSTHHLYAKGRVKRTYCQFKLEAIKEACMPYDCWVDKVNVVN